MDPDECLNALIDAFCAGSYVIGYEYAQDLFSWMYRGGYAPHDPR